MNESTHIAIYGGTSASNAAVYAMTESTKSLLVAISTTLTGCVAGLLVGYLLFGGV